MKRGRMFLVSLIFTIIALGPGFSGLVDRGAAQEKKSKEASLAYNRLYKQQQKLFDQWAEQQNRAEGTKIPPVARYEQLPFSQQTTFEAATHALVRSKLTDQNGKSLGLAIDLVKELEQIAGEEKGKRGDLQFRLYVKVAPETEQILIASREFKRDKDNTVFHKGYPLNFRQAGRYPSIQVSMSRGGDRADIDVDYRSSKAPQALVNGHLTAANSDVRAGGNYFAHLSRWSGFINWWRSLFVDQSKSSAPAVETMAAATDVVEQDLPDGAVIDDIATAAQEFFNDWLIRRNERSALKFFSPTATACISKDDDSENKGLGTADARKLFIETLQTGNAALKKPRDLSKAIVAVEPWDPAMKVIDHGNKAFFTLVSISDTAAKEFLCSIQSPVEPTEASAPLKYGDYYQTFFSFKIGKGQGGGMVLLWKKQNGRWFIVSYDELEM